jgi:cytoskeletal protein RodZ
MSDLGSQLRAAREAKGLSLDQVFKATRIKAAYIEALESNRIDALPGIVQARGFVRTYANYLGLDGEALASTLDTGSLVMSMPVPPADSPRSSPTHSSQDPQGRIIELAKPVGTAPSKPIEPAASQPIGTTTKPVTAKLDRSPAPAQSATGKLRVPTFSSTASKPPASSMGGIPTPVLLAGAIVLFLIGAVLILTALAGAPKSLAPSSSTLDSTTVINSVPAQVVAMNSGPLSLTLAASEHVWVRITTDGQTALEGMLSPNETQDWTADDQIIVETGNAAALSVTCDGQTSVLGDRGQVVARAWNHGSIEDVPITAPDDSTDLPAQPTNIATTPLKP